MEVLHGGSFDIQKSVQPQKRTHAQSAEPEPERKRRLMSADSFCFSLEDLTSRLYSKHDANTVQEEDSLYEDDFCFWCDARRYEDAFKCPYHGNQTTNVAKEKQQTKKPYAYQNIPNMLQLYSTKTPDGARTGVKTVQQVPAGAWIGPYEGTVVKKEEVPSKNNHMWEIFKDGQLHGYIDGSDVNKSSWMRFIKRADYQGEQNLWAFQYQEKIFYRANKTIFPGQELAVWYDQQYTKRAGMVDKDARKEMETKKGEQLKPDSILSWPSPIKVVSQQLPAASQNSKAIPGTIQMETTFTRIGALMASPTKTEFPRINNGETETSPSKPIPRVSTGFSLKITDSNFTGRNEANRCSPTSPASHSSSGSSPTSPCTPSSSDSGFSFETGSAESPSKSETNEMCVWRCGQCKRSFAQRAMLQVHVCANLPFKPYKCGHCDKSFSTSGEMRAHAVIHQGKKPFKCGYCARSFTGATTLNNHIRIHTGEKPFRCEKCKKTFSQGSQLSKHEKIPGDCIPKTN